MARLPVPGADENVWGDVLNAFLTVDHNSDGTLKTSGTIASKADDSAVVHLAGSETVTGTKTFSASPIVPTPTTSGQAATKGYVDSTILADATTTTKGIVQLAGDLAGTASAPTVPGLATKANTSTTVSAGTGLTGGGDLSTDRTISANFGTTAGTIAQGNDSRITGAVQSTLADAKGDILVATAADTITRLAVGSDDQVLTADSSQASGLRWAASTSATDTNDAYPLSGYGFFAASENISACRDSGALDQAWFARVFIPAGKAINAISGFSAGAGTVGAGGLNGFAVYTDSGTLVTSTPDDNTMWETAGWVIKVLGTPVAAQGSDRFVYIGIASRGYTAPPTIRYFTAPDGIINGGGYLVDKRRSFYNGISSWPASIDPQTYGNAAGGFLPLVTLG